MAAIDLTADRLRNLLEYDKLSGCFTWKVQRSNVAIGSIAGSLKSDGYHQIGIDGSLHLSHRLAWLYMHGSWPIGDIDHINGQITDNRESNLRDVSRLINMQNQRRPQKNNSCGYLGVFFDKRRNKYIARIREPGELNMRYIGQFETPEDAHNAYLKAKRELHVGCTI